MEKKKNTAAQLPIYSGQTSYCHIHFPWALWFCLGNLFGLEKSIALLNRVLFNLHFLETVADVDEVLGEMFLEEIQPTEAQLIVGILGFHLSWDQN